MRAVAFLLFSILSIALVNGGGFEDIRACPSGYFYAGDDTPPDDVEDLQSYWVLGRSPVYSCYKQIPLVSGINDGLEQCYTSVMDSDDMEARVVIFEDAKEVERVFTTIDANMPQNGDSPISYNGSSITILTSAMNFDVGSEKIWIYLGTNYTNVDVEKIISETTNGEEAKPGDGQCLTVTGIKNEFGYNDNDEEFIYQWNAVDCVDNTVDVLCEIRIETVTYAWVPNWLTITLLILTIVLLVTCCMAALSYKQYTPRPYRGSQHSPQVSAYPVDDAPPKYSDVTGVSANQDQGKLDKYKNKGKEILAKIYVVKDR